MAVGMQIVPIRGRDILARICRYIPTSIEAWELRYEAVKIVLTPSVFVRIRPAAATRHVWIPRSTASTGSNYHTGLRTIAERKIRYDHRCVSRSGVVTSRHGWLLTFGIQLQVAQLIGTSTSPVAEHRHFKTTNNAPWGPWEASRRALEALKMQRH